MVRAAVYRRKLPNPAQSHVYHCTGILFTYQNGGQRAVGERRLGLDDCVVYDNPFKMVFYKFHVESSECRKSRRLSEATFVCLRVEFRTKEEELAMIRPLAFSRKRPMEGRVGFWMTEFDTLITFSPGTENEFEEWDSEAGLWGRRRKRRERGRKRRERGRR